jgi:hypothetical protein
MAGISLPSGEASPDQEGVKSLQLLWHPASFLDLPLALLLWNSGSNPCLLSRVAAVHNFLGGSSVPDENLLDLCP